MIMRASTFEVNLPKGFTLQEDEDNLYLFYRDNQIAVFTLRGVTPAGVLKVVEDFLKEDED